MTAEQQKRFQEKMGKHSSLKALQILCAMAYLGKECGISDIGKLTGLSGSSIHRVLQELAESGLAAKGERKYRLGSEALTLFHELRGNDLLLEAANLEMMRLNDLTNETVHLIALEGMDAVYIDKRATKNQIGLNSMIGKHIPLYCTSGGKALLAYQEKEWLELYFAVTPLTRLTDTTITEQDALLEELALIRQQGYALDNSEHNPGVVCVAAPVFYPDGRVACTIGIATPKYRMDENKLRYFTAEVMISAKKVTDNLA